ncbi:MAG: hypothetical protein RL044_1072 [Actinomycetota bacterium]
MLAIEKRPKTGNVGHAKIRPKTSSRRDQIHSSKGKTVGKNKISTDPKMNQYSVGKVCFSACTQRLKSNNEKRPFTAPELHQIP